MPIQAPPYRGTYASADLPNVAGSSTQDRSIKYGDWCLNTTLGQSVVCTDPTLGAATWQPVGGTPQVPYVSGALGPSSGGSLIASVADGPLLADPMTAWCVVQLNTLPQGNFQFLQCFEGSFVADGWGFTLDDSNRFQFRAAGQSSSWSVPLANDGERTRALGAIYVLTGRYDASGDTSLSVNTFHASGNGSNPVDNPGTGTYCRIGDASAGGFPMGECRWLGGGIFYDLLSDDQVEQQVQTIMNAGAMVDGYAFSMEHLWVPDPSADPSGVVPDTGSVGGFDFAPTSGGLPWRQQRIYKVY